MKTVKIAIRTRDKELAERLQRMMRRWKDALCVLMEPVAEKLPADILFLDADTCPFPERSWPDFFHALVMISDDASRAIDAYQRHPSAFLRSRPTDDDFRAVMRRCFPAWRDGLRRLNLSGRCELPALPMGRIQYVEASGRESVIRCDGLVYAASTPIGKLAEQLPNPPFFRCQRSFIIHLSAVGAVLNDGLIMAKDGRPIPVSRKCADDFREALERWNALEGVPAGYAFSKSGGKPRRLTPSAGKAP